MCWHHAWGHKLVLGEREKKKSRKTGNCALNTWMHWRVLCFKDFYLIVFKPYPIQLIQRFLVFIIFELFWILGADKRVSSWLLHVVSAFHLLNF